MENIMRINSIQSYNNYNNRISYKSGYAGNKCYATKVADSISFNGRDPLEALKEYLRDSSLGCVDENTTRESTLVNDLDMDSCDLLELQIILERITGEEIPDEEYSNKFLTVGDVVDYMTNHKEAFSASRIEGARFLPGYYQLLCYD